jgi:hypothetical protein
MPRFDTQPCDAVHRPRTSASSSRLRPATRSLNPGFPRNGARSTAGTEHGTQRGSHGGAGDAEEAAIRPAQIEHHEENAA